MKVLTATHRTEDLASLTTIIQTDEHQLSLIVRGLGTAEARICGSFYNPDYRDLGKYLVDCGVIQECDADGWFSMRELGKALVWVEPTTLAYLIRNVILNQ